MHEFEKASIADAHKCLKKHKADSHKGENGCVLVIGGCEEYVSAPALSALAALRTGIDLIVVASPEKAAYAINSFSIDFITKKMKGKYLEKKHAKELLKYAETFDAVLIGPGLGKKKEVKEFVNEFLKKVKVPVIVDADAIQQIEKKNITGLMCPHEREFEIAFKEKLPKDLKKRIALVKVLAKKHKCTILLKGRIDIVSDGKKVKINSTGNPGMTVGGTGDVLSGMCAGLVAQGGNYFDAASGAAYLSGSIGDKLFSEYGYGFIASDLIPWIPKKLYKEKLIPLDFNPFRE